jgi:hypothetical protein
LISVRVELRGKGLDRAGHFVGLLDDVADLVDGSVCDDVPVVEDRGFECFEAVHEFAALFLRVRGDVVDSFEHGGEGGFDAVQALVGAAVCE